MNNELGATGHSCQFLVNVHGQLFSFNDLDI